MVVIFILQNATVGMWNLENDRNSIRRNKKKKEELRKEKCSDIIDSSKP